MTQKEKEQQISPPAGANSSKGEMIPIDGFEQVVDLLKAADETFRISLIKRIKRMDPKLAQELVVRLRNI